MMVVKQVVFDTDTINVGDKIVIQLNFQDNNPADFTATAHKVTDKGVLFIFDEYVTCRTMNERRTNEGGFEASDLKKWLDTELIKTFPGELRDRITDLSIPSVGELFGHSDKWNEETFEPDTDEQLPLMKKRRNRVAYYNNEYEWGWLRNATKKALSATLFAFVYDNGRASCNGASSSRGVRPEFWLVR